MTQSRRNTSTDSAVPRQGRLRTAARTKAASAKSVGKTAIRVSRTTKRVGRQIIADRHHVLRELADR